MKKLMPLILLLAAFSLSAKPAKMPEWVQNYRKIYPDSEYLCQRGSGKTAAEAQTDAAAALARYFKMNVAANLSTAMTSISGAGGISEETKVIDDVRVMSQVDFFGLEYTEPYYFKKEKKWYCVAFINRENAWIQYKPQIEISKNTFEGLLKNVGRETDSFTKLKLLKTVWAAGKDLTEKLEYARIISPTNEATYGTIREHFSEIPVIFETEKSKCKTFVTVRGDYSEIFSTAISSVLADCGFGIVKTFNEAAYIVEMAIEDNVSGNQPLAIMPTVNIKIINKNNKTVFSYETSSQEKTLAYSLETAQRKAYPKLATEIKAVMENEFKTALKL